LAKQPVLLASRWAANIGKSSKDLETFIGAEMSLRFGDFVLDPGTRQLRRGEEERHLGPKAFELLELLLQRRPNVVTKGAIHDRLWPGTFVSGSTLATVVGEIRAALEDDASSPCFLRTVHGVGYAFCGDVREDETSPAAGRALPGTAGPAVRLSFRLLFDDREISLRPGENLLGRVDDGVLWIDSPSVSRRHARIRVEGGQATLEDLGSKNGTYWRGARIIGPVLLSDGDEILLGKIKLTVRKLPVDATTLTDQAE
jgi:DNA-binding winged helix-turn-helix (wHTH) protein